MASMQLVEDTGSTSDAGLLETEQRVKPRRWLVATPFLGAAAAAAVLTSHYSSGAGRLVRGTETIIKAEEGPAECGGPNEECLDSKCCKPGGENGYQCYSKNAGWALCLPGCEKGAHEGETEGTYDQWGTFKPAEWSCEKLGNRSKKACEYYDEKSCHKDRCTWSMKNGTKSCLPLCNYMDYGTCGQNEHCMWFQDKCQPGCGSESECFTDRCVKTGDNKCLKACWTYNSMESCPKWMQCIYEDGHCKEDPCSSPDESCLDTGCCSSQRGGQGMTCFKKDKYYAQCRRTCDQEDWSCSELGNRTKMEAGCAWPGQDCLATKLCCQEGFACVKKDDQFTGCTQTKEKHTWMDVDVKIPSDWEGTVYGGSRAEYAWQPAGEDEPAAGTKLFCFMAYLPGSPEEGLMELAKELDASIFGCDESSVYKSWGSGSEGWDTGESTITNTDVFLNVWQQVQNEGKWKRADWSVKVDPDAVLVADRLRWHIEALRAPAYVPIYLKNNGMDPGLGNNGFLGAIEVFSTAAVELYFDNWEDCRDSYGLATGEDGFFKGCMDSLGVGYMTDVNIFNPDFSPGACINGDMVGFHPLKEWSQWRCCWDLVQGKNRKVEYGKCDMGPDGKGPEVEPADYERPGR